MSADEKEVTFRARAGETQGGESKQIPITLPTVEFTRRIGGWSNPRREAYLERCARQLDLIDAFSSAEVCEFGPFDDAADELEGASELCPACGGKMILQGQREKPSWHEIMTSVGRPSWYRVPVG